jgi:hypothetical protein
MSGGMNLSGSKAWFKSIAKNGKREDNPIEFF